jgi:hypothetical protein
LSSLVLEHVPGPAKTKKEKAKDFLPKAAFTALRALGEAEIDVGIDVPSGLAVPAGIETVIRMPDWRAAAYDMGISSGNDRAKQQAFKRAVKTLTDKGFVGADPKSNYVWLLPKP